MGRLVVSRKAGATPSRRYVQALSLFRLSGIGAV
jgi:hypothetical protein